MREKVKEEFEDTIQHLSRTLTVEAAKFQEYKAHVYKDLQAYLDEVKQNTTLQILDSETAPMELKRTALKIARLDDELNKVKRENLSLERTVSASSVCVCVLLYVCCSFLSVLLWYCMFSGIDEALKTL